jgi:hypothetical protein
MRPIAAGLGLLLAIVLVACGSQATEDSLTPDDGLGDATSGEFTDDAGNTMQFGPGTTLPDNWPADLPIPSGELLSVSVSQDGGALGTWTVPDNEAEALLTSYLQELEAAGFSAAVESSLSVPDEGVFTYELSGFDFDLVVSGVVVPGESEITVIASRQVPAGA